MLNSAIYQQPDLLKNIVAHWEKLAGGQLLLISPEGELLAGSGLSPSVWQPVVEQLSLRSPTFSDADGKNILATSLIYDEQTLGYLLAVDAHEDQVSLLAWVADVIVTQAIDAHAMQSMTDELIGAWDQLELIFRVTENLALTADLTSVLRSILHEIKKVTHTEDGFILLQFPETMLCVAAGSEHKRTMCDDVLLNNLVQANRVVLCNSISACRQIWPHVPCYVNNFVATRFYVIEENTQAAIGLINKSEAGFTAGDSKLLAALAQQVATIINNHLTHQKLVIEERVSRELEIAAEIQESLLPTQLPQMGGLSMAVSSTPASEVGGDFYDFVTLDDRHLTLIIGDVSGKGIPAAMLTSVTRTMLRVEAMRGEPPHKIIQQVNHVLHPDLSRADSFVTVFVATIDTLDGKITYAGAGHTPPLLWRSQDKSVEMLKATSLPLGIFDIQENQSRTVDLFADDTLVFYTDGITEAQSPNCDLFGLNRLISVVESRGGDSPEPLQQFIQAEVSDFRQNADWQDDATLLILKNLSQTEPVISQGTSTVEKTVDFQYPADMDHLGQISQQVSNTCRALSALPPGSRGDDFIYLIELAISEICTNIIKHAYGGTKGQINGQVTLLNNGVQLDFFDEGAGFDPTSVPEPKADPNNLREGGFGLHIVRQIMDVVSYENQPETGNHWHLIKFLPSQKP